MQGEKYFNRTLHLVVPVNGSPLSQGLSLVKNRYAQRILPGSEILVVELKPAWYEALLCWSATGWVEDTLEVGQDLLSNVEKGGWCVNMTIYIYKILSSLIHSF